MGKYLITGTPGTGKSTIIHELARRGYAAYDTDDIDDATALHKKATGEIVDWPDPPIDWTKYEWNWQHAKIHELLASGNTVFLGAIVGNQEDFYPQFNKIFVLTLDDSTLKHRILTRTGNEYGKHPGDLAHLFAKRPAKMAKLLAEPRAVPIDASRPLDQVADNILRHIT